jgi:putative two-component system hydrogenase maturation factor HypX/HoxX
MSEVKVLVLTGSHRNWSNGINLNVIEAASDSAAEGWRNITAINEVVKTLHGMKDKIVISAVQTNAGAGGVYMALAADFCFAKKDTVLNPHYKNMGLFGSELHTATAV